MKLPKLVTDDKSAHFFLLLLCSINLLLIVIIFFLLSPQTRKFLPKIIPISEKTPIVDFNLISPSANSTVTGTVPLITTLSNGPKITSAQLTIDGQKVQAVTSQKTERLTIYWDSTKSPDGKHTLVLSIGQDNQNTSTLTTALTVQNNISRNVGER